jgi:hypothetical protein
VSDSVGVAVLKQSDAQPIRRLVQSLHDVIPQLSWTATAVPGLDENWDFEILSMV